MRTMQIINTVVLFAAAAMAMTNQEKCTHKQGGKHAVQAIQQLCA